GDNGHDMRHAFWSSWDGLWKLDCAGQVWLGISIIRLIWPGVAEGSSRQGGGHIVRKVGKPTDLACYLNTSSDLTLGLSLPYLLADLCRQFGGEHVERQIALARQATQPLAELPDHQPGGDGRGVDRGPRRAGARVGLVGVEQRGGVVSVGCRRIDRQHAD